MRPEKRPGPPKFRLNPRRQALWVVVALAAIFGGYWAVAALRGGDDRKSSLEIATREPVTEPWYRSQSPPPTLITVPDAPIYPDPLEIPPVQPVRAYEEALPVEVYESPDGPTARLPIPPPPPEPPDEEAAPAAVITAPPQGVGGGMPPWRRFALAVTVEEGAPRIAVVIDDMGMDRRRSARAVALAAPLTLSFLAYAADLEKQTEAARAAGHELLLHVPMEPGTDRVDPGPKVLLTEHREAELRDRLTWDLARFGTYVGINNHMGGRFTEYAPGMTLVLEELGRRGLMFLDSRTTPRTVSRSLARRFGVPFAERNIFLDNVNDVAAVRARLIELEDLARRRGSAIAIGHPRDATLEALATWLPLARERGFLLVPVSALAITWDAG